MNPKPILSLVIPCFNEEEALPVFYETAEQELEVLRSRYEIEYIFIDDGSKDATLAGMRDLAEKDQSVHYISFSRNVGKDAAIYAGLERSSGDITVTLDVDLQDPPSLIPEMVKAVTQEGFDCAGSRRVTRKGEPPVRSFFARRFYRLINRLSDVEIVDGARDFRCMNREYLNAVLSLKERNRFSKGIFPWVGFKTKWFEYENRERSVGETKWSFFKLLLYSLDGIAAFSTKPLAAASVCGFFFSFSSLLLILFIVVRKILFGGSSVDGWASLVCTVLFMGGLQLLTIGLLGQYVAKIYIEVKQRPLFVIKEQK